MRMAGYYLIRFWIRVGLFFYFRKIKVVGESNIPKDGPLLFVGNHQNALLDALIIAVTCGIKPYFLTRGDVFKNPLARRLFGYLQMIPVYRIRNGKEAVGLNHSIFNQCASLLLKEKQMLIFPEGSHSLKRRVRSLSKGFTRILFKALEENPSLNIKLLPVGLNYIKAEVFPDSAAVYYGKPIEVLPYYDRNNLPDTIKKLKSEVYTKLSELTTHIENEINYDEIIASLEGNGADYLNPIATNKMMINMPEEEYSLKKETVISKILKFVFVLFNLPCVFLWRLFLKPKLKEIEFTSTFRFGFALVFYTLGYVILFILLGSIFGYAIAGLILLSHIGFNLIYVKTSHFF